MNLSQLYYFAKLSEMQHYANAAKELYITQPSLSHAIKSLEAELGAPLFEREGRRMKLTPLGRAFAEHVKRGLREIDKGVALAQEYNGKLSGTVNIGAIYTVQGDYLPMLFRDYHAQYGQTVKFNLFQGFSTPLVEALERDEYDVAFTAKVRSSEKRLAGGFARALGVHLSPRNAHRRERQRRVGGVRRVGRAGI